MKIGLAGIIAASSQAAFPIGGVWITPADLLFGICFPVILYDLFKKREVIHFPYLLFTPLMFLCLSAFSSRSGFPGAVEFFQRCLFLFFGVIIFTRLLRENRELVTGAAVVGLFINLLIAMNQASAGGFGTDTSGLFTSRTALAFYISLCMVLVFPSIQQLTHRGTAIAMGFFCMTLAGLIFIPNGAIALITLPVLTLIAFLTGFRKGILFVGIALIYGATFIAGYKSDERVKSAGETLRLFEDGKPVQVLAESLAGLRAARDKPLIGFGPGHYQEHIGEYYRELSNPNYNQIEQDTQSGWGILAASAGFPSAISLLLVLCCGAAFGIKKYTSANTRLLALGSAGALMITLFGMFFSDPFVRGTGWFVALSFAAAFSTPSASIRDGYVKLTHMSAAVVCAIICLLTLASALRKPKEAITNAERAQVRTVFETDLFVLLEANDTEMVTKPMLIEENSEHGTVLSLPDNSCVIPEGFDPDLKYGGAEFRFESDKDSPVAVWLLVRWEGSCANSVFVKMNDSDPIAVGNDGTYNVWHWLKSPVETAVSEGENYLTLLNREDGIKISQILVTADTEYVPQGREIE